MMKRIDNLDFGREKIIKIVMYLSFLILTISCTPIYAQDQNIIMYVNFDNHPTGTYTEQEVQSDWNPEWTQGVKEGRCEIVEGQEAYKGKSLRCKYNKGSLALNSWFCRLGTQYNELYCSYWVKFASGFDFRQTGKIPGLLGGKYFVGAKPDGTGFGAKPIWREDGKVCQYVYHPEQPTIWGEDFPWNIGGQRYFKPGVWHFVQTRVVINTPGKHDGIIQSWSDETLVLDKKDFMFRTISTFAIDVFYFNTHFGGQGAECAPSKDEYICFDEMIVSKSRVTP